MHRSGGIQVGEMCGRVCFRMHQKNRVLKSGLVNVVRVIWSSSAKVLSITTLDGQDDGMQTVSSDYDNSFVYRVGEIVRVDDFDDNRWRECSREIHFFITRDEAVRYS